MPEPNLDWPKLLSLVAHELRTPAGVVTGYLRLLQQGRAGSLTDAQQKLVEAADRSSDRVSAILDDLSDLAKLESGTVQLARQRAPLPELLAALRPAAAQFAITVHGDVPAVELEADLARVRRALAALAMAARRSPDDREPVLIRSWESAGLDALDVWIALGSRDAVADVGPHVRGTRLPYDCWRGGHGLDLVLAARVIALHEGELWTLMTRPGSAVTLVRLPAASSQAA